MRSGLAFGEPGKWLTSVTRCRNRLADGAVKYANPMRAREQLYRDARLREAGFEVVHFTWQGLHSAPGQVAASIRAAFSRGGTV